MAARERRDDQCWAGLTSSTAARSAQAHPVCNLPILVSAGGGGEAGIIRNYHQQPHFRAVTSTSAGPASLGGGWAGYTSVILIITRGRRRGGGGGRGGGFLCNKDWVKWSSSRGTGEREGLQLSLFVLVFRRGWHSSSSHRILVTLSPSHVSSGYPECPEVPECPECQCQNVQFFCY